MKTLPNRSRMLNAVRAFHQDEGGMEAIQSVITTAIAAMVMAGVWYLWKTTKINGQDGISGAISSSVNSLLSNVTNVVTK
jgi:hypothetical protein